MRKATIKAAAYEKKYALAHRRGGRHILLDFHLLSVFEGGMKENYCSGTANEISDVTEIKYINRHIIDGADRSYRVHFIDSEAFPEILAQYDQAAEALPELCAALYDEFYRDVFQQTNRPRLTAFWKLFKDELFKEMYEARACYPDQSIYNNSWLTDYKPDSRSGALLLYWDLSFITDPKRTIAELNKDALLLEKTAQKLEQYFRYTGPFRFVLEPNPAYKF